MDADQAEEIKRHVEVVAEALRSDVRQVVEGHAVIRREILEFRQELKDEFAEVRALMRLSSSQLDHRLKTLETDLTLLKARAERLESGRA